MLKRHGSLVLALLALAGASGVYSPLEDQARASGVVQTEARKAETLDEIFITRMTGAFRGLFINALWMQAIAAERNYEWHRLVTLYERIRRLQPRYPEVWVHSVNNLAFQLSWDPATPDANWKYISQALAFGLKGFAYNPDDARIAAALSEIYQFKIGKERYYRRRLWEQERQKYSEQTLKWLEIAYSKENARAGIPLELWGWYTLFRYHAAGAKDQEQVKFYEKKLAELEDETKRRYEIQYRVMKEWYPRDLNMLNAKLQRMVTDLVYEEEAVEGRWAWIHGALLMADDFLAGRKPTDAEVIRYADLQATLAQIYHFGIYPVPGFKQKLAQDRPKEDCLLRAKGLYMSARSNFARGVERSRALPELKDRERLVKYCRDGLKDCLELLLKLAEELKDADLERDVRRQAEEYKFSLES